jgi:hypothetical protein
MTDLASSLVTYIGANWTSSNTDGVKPDIALKWTTKRVSDTMGYFCSILVYRVVNNISSGGIGGVDNKTTLVRFEILADMAREDDNRSHVDKVERELERVLRTLYSKKYNEYDVVQLANGFEYSNQLDGLYRIVKEVEFIEYAKWKE